MACNCIQSSSQVAPAAPWQKTLPPPPPPQAAMARSVSFCACSGVLINKVQTETVQLPLTDGLQPILAIASNPIAMASNPMVMASNLMAMASNQIAMASNPVVMASNLIIFDPLEYSWAECIGRI